MSQNYAKFTLNIQRIEKFLAHRDVDVTDVLFRRPNPGVVAAGVPRSSKWPAVRAAHLKANPSCEACGQRDAREVHHVQYRANLEAARIAAKNV